MIMTIRPYDLEEPDFREADYVDSQYEYLLKNKDKGITLEELCRLRSEAD